MSWLKVDFLNHWSYERSETMVAYSSSKWIRFTASLFGLDVVWILTDRWSWTIGYGLGYCFSRQIKKRGGSILYCRRPSPVEVIFTVSQPLPQPSFLSTAATKFCSSSFPCFFPYSALGLTPECCSWCNTAGREPAGRRQPAARGKRSSEGKRFGPCKIHQIFFANPWFLG